ncbi:class I SAM-dependent methyltransferase [Candidatus Roizmanbacteria bacterium]|nr:class I SAM-dependent methyltransferase [Candidatus Roizmanbacteria bacterium]
MQKSWFDYYKKNKTITVSNLFLHWPYLLRLVSLLPKNLLEIGCGPADHSIALSYIMPSAKISVLDNDEKIIAFLKTKYKNKISDYFLCDLTKKENIKRLKLKKNRYDMIYSQGLMEHFKDEDFVKIIENLLPYTNKMIHSVPSDSYPTKDFGNEILRNREELKRLLSSIEGINFKIIRYFPDIGLRTKIVSIKKFNFNLPEALSFLLFGSCHYLIEISKTDVTS